MDETKMDSTKEMGPTIGSKRKTAKPVVYLSILQPTDSIQDVQVLVHKPITRKDGKVINWSVRLQLGKRNPLIGLLAPVSFPFGISPPRTSVSTRAPKRVAVRLEEAHAIMIQALYTKIYESLILAEYEMHEEQPRIYPNISRGADEQFPPLLNTSLFPNVQVQSGTKWGAGLRFTVTTKPDKRWYLNITIVFLGADSENLMENMPYYIAAPETETEKEENEIQEKKAKTV